MFVTLVSAILATASPQATSPAPAAADAPVEWVPGASVEAVTLRLPAELEERREQFAVRLALLQERYASATDIVEARALQIEIRDEKLGFEIALMQYQLANARRADKATDTATLEATIAALRGMLSPAAAQRLAEPAQSGD